MIVGHREATWSDEDIGVNDSQRAPSYLQRRMRLTGGLLA
jgi:hypothetical protein